jgi:superfamily II DNA or RNA helicase
MSAATLFLPGLAEPAAPSLDEVQAMMIEAIVARRTMGRPSTILQAATGTGKTFTAAKLIRRGVADWGGKFLFLAHRKELVDQAAAEFKAAGLRFAVEQGGRRGSDAMLLFGGVDVVIGSKDSMQKDRLLGWRPDAFTDIITDECHLATADTFRKVVEHFRPRFHVGLTATPYRLDGTPLYGTEAAPFEGLAYSYPLPEAIANGHLADITAVTCQTMIPLKGIRTTRTKDFNLQDLEDRISRNIHPIANDVRRTIEAKGIRKALAMTPDVGSARALAQALNQVGVTATAVHGHSKRNPMTDAERDRIIRAYREGDFTVLTSCDLLTTGFNDRPTEAVIVARPTKSLGLFMQMVGRGTRLCPEAGKDRCYVVGFAWDGADGVVSSVDLFLVDEPSPRVREQARKLAGLSKKDVDPKELVAKARAIVAEAEREESLRVRVRKEDTRNKRLEWSPFGERTRRLLGPVEARPDPAGAAAPPASDGQRRLLDGFGLKGTRKLDAGTADVLAGRVLDRAFLGLADARQVEALVKRGVPEAEAMAMKAADANRVINAGYRPSPRMRSFLRLNGYRDEVISRMGPKDVSDAYGRLKERGRR